MSKSIPSLIDMLTQLIATPSVSCTAQELDMSNRPVIDLLATWLSAIGFEIEVMPVPGYAGKYNLIATLGQGPGGLVLSGHTDTVPFNEEKWKSNPFTLTEKDQRLYGLGSCDMKGFFALAIEAAKQFVDHPFKSPLIILATADEESSMSGAQALADAGKPKARYAVIGEPTSLRPIRMHKGIMMEGIKITGRSGHSSDPSLGANALDAMHKVLGELMSFRQEMQSNYRNSAFRVDVPTLNLGCIHGGDNPNRICGQCELEYDLRPLPGMDMSVLREGIYKRVKPLETQYDVIIDCAPIFNGIPSFETAANAELVQMAEKLTGYTADAVAFATEAPFLQSLGMETIVMGPGSIDQAHQPDEFIALDQIRPTVDILSHMIKRYCLQ
ncbi:acetylornithine deacetylase [Neptunomonas phycophila]|uniref:Acetylornithine deacetylase n=1 Tax=Neptunomonas phycophila TaxID=1572645 RepID=A0AAW7XHF1_9GAMM|nr:MULTISPECIES: acetylornithine deacetylase [Neptunomonas]MDN2660808.1 acetylornithine deacetylase [Neptunomonas sp. CHC150]MDO6453748.1 acetylornithine deacetylase [Neptunomonas phycophila]